MSLNHLLDQVSENKFLNPRLNSLKINAGLDMSNSGITNVASINGLPINVVADSNPTSIVLRPGGLITPGSNIVNTWNQVLIKASQINVSEILNIYIDDSIISPVLLDISHDFKGRGVLCPYKSNASSDVNCQIPDGVTISNLDQISQGPLKVNCDSQTAPSLAFDNGQIFKVINGASLKLTATATVPAIQLNASQMILSLGNSGMLDNSLAPTVGVVDLQNVSTLLVVLNNNLGTNPSGSISGDAGSSIQLFTDSSLPASSITFPLFLGTLTKTNTSMSLGVSYDDSKLPVLGVDNVQNCLDYLKQNYEVAGVCLPLAGGIMSGNIQIVDGSSPGNLSISFASNNNLGIYKFGANSIGIGNNGQKLLVDNTFIQSAAPHYFESGSAAIPSITYNSDSNTGFYSAGADQIGVTCNGVSIMNLSQSTSKISNDLEVDGKLGLYNNTPISQATTGGASSVFVAGVGVPINDVSTFDGYTVAQIVKALRNVGLLA